MREYDAAGRPVSITDALGHVTRYRYDQHGRLVELTDARGGSKHFQYNREGWLTSYTDCSGHTSEYQYDALGRLEATRDALDHATRYEYDALGRLIRLTAPDQTREQYAYDADGSLALHEDAAGQQTRYRYNGQGLPVERMNAIGQTLQYRYDSALQLTELINAKGESYRLAYHAEGWLASEAGFDGKRFHPPGRESAWSDMALRYDAENRLSHATRTQRQSRHRAQYFYDAFSRRIAKRVEEARWTSQQDITKDQPAHTSASTTFFVWDGDTLAQELGQDETVTYLYEPDSFVPLARIGSPACRQASAVHLPRVA
ncbi:RHS repeat protein [Janthinobacterium lividum]|uniref:RHS repeat protein n=1 Tax=Janthinobacterium lividum TaxID=29581 RepID=UPI001407D9B9|nr:RHS repeat protein [Janthinobacterium lividum]NHQ94239.1 RHS repeat protein [Janthinobacterium lividum]